MSTDAGDKAVELLTFAVKNKRFSSTLSNFRSGTLKSNDVSKILSVSHQIDLFPEIQ